MDTQKQQSFKDRLKEYMEKNNIKANTSFLDNADSSNIRTRKANSCAN